MAALQFANEIVRNCAIKPFTIPGVFRTIGVEPDPSDRVTVINECKSGGCDIE